ncbi:DEAD/DEAH box helicase [Floridanema evergladense]|uniref:DNA 3'-5' helicase n=1 Tax=Floridaenema evergladense BLCC-F167 TaxID=3153639 RepID=A0ABV4WHA3_9CYAN
MINSLPDYQSCLKRFGIEQFRSKQEQAVCAILRGEKPLVIMPTGGGKSLCYQIPALMLFERQRALTVVISPLQALMVDQVKDLEEQGLNFCTFINGNLTVAKRSQRLKELRCNTYGLLYISPEQLRSPSIRALLQERPPALWVIDEAHCISQWGHDFRPDYRYLPKFIKELYHEQSLPLLALMTATARTTVEKDIRKLFAKHNLPIGNLIWGRNHVAVTRGKLNGLV